MKKAVNRIAKKLMMIMLASITMLTAMNFNSGNILAATDQPEVLYNIAGTEAQVTEGMYSAWWADGIGKIQVNGEIAFCIEPTVVTLTGPYTVFDDLSYAEKRDLSLIVHYGWDSTAKTDTDYAVTQFMIWQRLGASVTFNGSFGSQYPSLKANVQTKINSHYVALSFKNGSYTINVGDSLTLNDTNGVLGQFHVTDNGGASVTISGNNLVITPNVNTPTDTTIKLQKIRSDKLGTSLAYRTGNGQDVGVFKVGDPFENEIKIHVNEYVDVTLHKEDLETGTTPQGDARLIGAEYSLYKADGTFVETKTVSNNLTLTFEKLMPTDEYYIQETKAPTGYKLNSEKITIKPLELLTDGTVGEDLQYSVTSKEEVIKGDFDITKIISDGTSGVSEYEQGAEFIVQLTSDITSQGQANAPIYDTLVTDANGYDKSILMPYGTYTVTQTKQGNENLGLAQSWQVVIKDENQATINYIVTNQLHNAYLKVVKYDEDTGETITYSNATFKIWNYKTNDYYTEQVGKITVDEWTTDEDGEFLTNREMKAGNYGLEEIKAPNGYNLNSSRIDFTITASNVHEDNTDDLPITVVRVSNKAPVGQLVLNKTFEDNPFSDERVAGFEVKNGMLPVINPATGEIIYNSFEQVINPNSEDGLWYVEDGQLIVDNLPMGTGIVTYTVQEKVTSIDYKLNDTVHSFTFSKTDDETEVYTQTLDIENELYHPTIGTTATGINGLKTLDPTIENEMIDISEVKDINPNKTYTIFVKFWKYDESGNGNHTVVLEDVYNDVTFEEADTTFTSKLLAEANTLEEGRYFFTEHFYEDGKDNPEVDTPIVEHNDPEDEGQTITMEKTEFTINVAKKDSTNNEIIKNKDFTFEAVFYDKDGKEIVGEKMSGNTKTGIATVTFKGQGTYDEVRIKETGAPDGYQLSKEVKVVTMDMFDDENVYTFDYFNDRVPAKVVKTSDISNGTFYMQLGGLSLLMMLGMLLAKKRATAPLRGAPLHGAHESNCVETEETVFDTQSTGLSLPFTFLNNIKNGIETIKEKLKIDDVNFQQWKFIVVGIGILIGFSMLLHWLM